MNRATAIHPAHPPMREFTVSNHLLGDPAALEAAWERDGYWFFRDVLDKDAVARLRHVYLDTMAGLGVVDEGRTDAAIWNGASLTDYPINNHGALERDPLLALNPRDTFVNEPKIRAFFEQLFGDEVFWVPNTEYHALAPHAGGEGSVFNYVHADGPNNPGLPLRIFWIPLVTIDEDLGGLAVAEGLHRPRMGDFPRPREGIDQNAVPPEAWRRTVYQPGDLLAFSMETPHSGLRNRSGDRFRLSMDIRGMRRSDNVPVVGTVAAVDASALAVDAEDGSHHVFRLDETTYCRIARGRLSGMPLDLGEISLLLKVGDPVYVASNRGTATFIRPQH